MNIKHAVAALALGASFGGVAHASTETFESCTGGGSIFTTLSAANPGPCGSIVAGISFAPDAGHDLYIAPPGQSANPTTALGVDLPNGGHDNISFTSPVTHFSADFNQNFGGGGQSGSIAPFLINTFLNGTAVGSYSFGVNSGSPTNFGFDSAPFNFLQVSQAEGYAVIDNVTFSSDGGAVPEPATWAMMLLGMALIGFAARRRQNVSVTYA